MFLRVKLTFGSMDFSGVVSLGRVWCGCLTSPQIQSIVNRASIDTSSLILDWLPGFYQDDFLLQRKPSLRGADPCPPGAVFTGTSCIGWL